MSLQRRRVVGAVRAVLVAERLVIDVYVCVPLHSPLRIGGVGTARHLAQEPLSPTVPLRVQLHVLLVVGVDVTAGHLTTHTRIVDGVNGSC